MTAAWKKDEGHTKLLPEGFGDRSDRQLEIKVRLEEIKVMTLVSVDNDSNIDEQAQKMYDELVQSFAKEEGCTEQLKASNQMLWVRKRNNAAQRAREVVNAELIYN